MNKWPELRRIEEAKNDQTAGLSQAFQELPTQNAFSTLSAQVQGIQSEISIIKRRTEPFSPSKNSLLHATNLTSIPSTAPLLPSFQISPALTPSMVPPAAPPAPIAAQVVATPVPNIPVSDFPTTPPRQAPTSMTQVLAGPLPNTLTPEIIRGPQNKVYVVLRLAGPVSPDRGQGSSLHTSYDKILPPHTAFPGSLYPSFTTINCTWQYTLKTISNPSTLWDLYAPANLGEYPTVAALWEAWDEGSYVSGVGRKVAIRLIEERWGNLKNEKTNTGRLPAWRPHNDPKVSFAPYPCFQTTNYCYIRRAKFGLISISSFAVSKISSEPGIALIKQSSISKIYARKETEV